MNQLILKNKYEILRIAYSHGAKDIKIFGSQARGDETENSDVDLLIELAPGKSLLDIIAIKQDIEDLLNCRVDVVTKSSISPYLRDQILNEAISL